MASRFILPYSDVGPGISPYDGAKLFFYATGTSTPLATYSNQALTIPNTNPVIADANGLFGNIFLQSAIYRVTLKDKNNVQIWDADPVTPIEGATVTIQNVSDYASLATYYVDSGTANNYILTQPEGLLPPALVVGKYQEGMLIRFSPKFATSGASTVKVGTGPTVAIRSNLDAATTSTSMAADGTEYYFSYRQAYNSGAGAFMLDVPAASSLSITEYAPSPSSYTASGTTYSFAHGLSAEPDLEEVVMQCTVTDGNFAVGDRVVVASTADINGATIGGFSIRKNSANIFIDVGTGGIQVIDKTSHTSATLTVGRWTFNVKAFVIVPGGAGSGGGGGGGGTTRVESGNINAGTSFSFTNLPSGLNKIEFQVGNILKTAVGDLLLQVGFGPTPTYMTTGYFMAVGGVAAFTSSSTLTGFSFLNAIPAAEFSNATLVLNRLSGNIWEITGTTSSRNAAGVIDVNKIFFASGVISMSGEMTAIKLIRGASDTWTFSSGSLTIAYS